MNFANNTSKQIIISNTETQNDLSKSTFLSKHKWVKKMIAAFALLLVLIALAGVYVYSNQNKILDFVIKELNASVKTEIKVKAYQLDLFSQFPEIAIHFNQVVCMEVMPKPKDKLFSFSSLYVNLNFWDVLQENYDIKKLKLENGEVNIKLYKDGSNNFTFWNATNDTTSTRIALSEVQFVNTTFTFYDQESDVALDATIDHLILNGEFWKKEFKAQINLVASNFNLTVEEDEILANNRIYIETGFASNPKKVSIEHGVLELNKLALVVNGSIANGESQWHIQGEKLSLPKLIDAIPLTFLPLKSDMKTTGIANLNAQIKTTANGVDVQTTIQIKNGSYNSKHSPLAIENLGLTATFSNGKRNNLSTSSLQIENAQGKTKTGSFFCDVDINNFKHPQILINGDVALDLEELMKISKPGIFESVKGKVKSSFTASNKYKSFAEIQTLALADAQFSGTMTLEKGYLKFSESNFALENITANIGLNGKDLTIGKLLLKSGDTEIAASGTLNKVLYFGNENYTPTLSLNISSPNLNAKEIANWQFGNPSSSNNQLPFNFKTQLNIKHFYWDDFNGYNLVGQVDGNAQEIVCQQISFTSSDGEIKGDFKINSENHTLVSHADISNLKIQNLFKELQNFNQKDLTYNNIKGDLNATLNLKMGFTADWQFVSKALNLDCDLLINNGELNNYKPLESLENFAEKENLKHVKFSKLKNRIEIKNSRIYIPQMHIASNALNLEIEGTHTFNSEIDYSIRLQLSKVLGKSGINKTGGYDDFIVIDDRSDKAFIWVKVGCTVSKPCTSLDVEKMAQATKNNFKSQGKELKNLFKKDSAKVKSTEPDYIFEWGEEPDTNNRNDF